MSQDISALIPPHTLEQQNLASNPNHSAWVSANAGSGKTHVLANRVVRLLLSGVNPSRILALTFTKTAAGEMAARVFDTLGKWSTMKDTDLDNAIEKIEGDTPKPAHREYARTLFARSLETPGGLKIQTIHAFCEALLHQFPLEANVAGNFTVLDPAEEQAMMLEARRWVILQAESGKAPQLAQALAAMMSFATDFTIDKVMSELVSRREEILGWLEDSGGADVAEQTTRKRLQIGPEETPEDIILKALEALNRFDVDLKIIADLASESDKKNDIKLARELNTYLNAKTSDERLEAARALVYTGSGGLRKYGTVATQFVTNAIDDAIATIQNFADVLEESYSRARTLVQVIETRNLMVLGEAMLTRYRLLKRGRGLLDFNDLIARTADLLLRKEARAWVLYKLDLGIDHVLLDEAQDTSPQQWSIVNALVEEFFAGEGASQHRRTVFAVGDEKQSIYSFQGARPHSFDSQRRAFETKLRGINETLHPANLTLSFRSAPAVLEAVDKVFAVPENRVGLQTIDSPPVHQALRKSTPGSVEVWDRVFVETSAVPQKWTEAIQPDGEVLASVKLAELVADQIQDWLERGEMLHPPKETPRPIRASDISILVRSRDTFIPALTRALKRRAIPVAGADRLAITDHIAIRDMIALGRIMLTPQDDLSLAALLRSPLFEISEDDLMDLALNRNETQSLWEALELMGLELEPKPQFGDAYSRLIRWRNRADTMPVFEFYARILGDDRGRHSLYARLGPEAEDVLDAFLALALKHEQGGLPGLQAFLQQLEDGDAEIKRELSKSRNEVRVMTVHAAKGQEAPIVFLVDKSSEAFSTHHRPALYRIGDEDAPANQRSYLWAPSKADYGDQTLAAEVQVREQQEQEYRRLLYVAMTRAENRLIVCGYRGKNTPKSPNWHDMVSNALVDELEEVKGFDEEVKVRRSKNAKVEIGTTVSSQHNEKTHLPPWIKHRMPQERALPRPLSPSGAQALIDEQLAQEALYPSVLEGLEQEKAPHSPFARRRGTALHKLLQMWPEIDAQVRHRRAQNYLANALPELSASKLEDLIAKVQSVIEAPHMRDYFDPATSRAEIPVMGRIDLASGPRPVSGTIDRLAKCDDHIMLLDYKTSTHPPKNAQDAPEHYVTQMALYRALVERIYPNKPVRAALIWTHASEGPRMMELPTSQLDHALETLTAM